MYERSARRVTRAPRFRAGPPPRVGETFAGFALRAELGRGAVATVYLAEVGARRFALKVLHEWLADDPEAIESFRDELRLSAFIRHPNVGQVVSAGDARRLPYLLGELVDGRAYSAVMRHAERSSSRLPVAFHLAVCARVAAGLHAAHEARDGRGASLGIVHRDVKPENVIVGFDGCVKLVDFGIARSSISRQTLDPASLNGTLAYLSPEQVLAPWSVDKRADIWALGVMLWEAVSRRRLFHRPSSAETLWNVVHLEPPPLLSVSADVPRDVSELVARCMAREREERPPDLATVENALRFAAIRGGFCSEQSIRAWMLICYSDAERRGGAPSEHSATQGPEMLQLVELVQRMS